MNENTKEPTLEEYGLSASSFEDYRNQKKELEKELYESSKDSFFDGLIGFVIYISVILGIPYTLAAFTEGGFFISLSIAFWIIVLLCYFFDRGKTKERQEKNSQIVQKIEFIKNKVHKFEKSCEEYYLNYLEEFFQNNLYKKRSGSEKFERSLFEFSSMIEEVEEINKKLIFTHIRHYYDSYLSSRKIDHKYQKEKKFNSFKEIKITEKIPSDQVLNSSNKTDTKNKSFLNSLINIKNDIKKETPYSSKPQKEQIFLKEITPPEKFYLTPRIIDWDNINKIKIETGKKGEEIIMQVEQNYLKSIARLDLAQRVKNVSKEIGDGLGYDVLSYFPNGEEKYIEVKSTIKSGGNSFYLSNNELNFLKNNKEKAYIYRLFNVGLDNEEIFLHIYSAENVLNSNKITPTQYLVKM